MINRELTIDYARAIAIFLVIVGHLIQYNVQNFDDNYFFKLIYSFHMPLFMLISGYVSYKSLFEKDIKIDLNNKLKSIFYPFVLWSLIYYTINGKFDYLNIFLFPASGYWFLWALFWIYIITKFSILLYNINKYLSIIPFLILMIFPTNHFEISMIRYMSVYFFIGLFLTKYKSNISALLTKTNKSLIIFSLITLTIIFFSFIPFYDRGMNFYYEYFGSNSIVIKLITYGFKITLALIGITLTLIVSYKINQKFKKNNIILIIGSKYTLHFYLLNILLVSTVSISFMYAFWLNTLITFSILFGCFYIFERYKTNTLLKILFGR